MRTVKYRTSWSYLGASQKREAPLNEFVLDILYLMERRGVILPLAVLNQVLAQGGGNGGMGPGTSWRPFILTEAEYTELVAVLQAIDVEEARKHHPYIQFAAITVDEELNNCTDYQEWFRRTAQKHGRDE